VTKAVMTGASGICGDLVFGKSEHHEETNPSGSNAWERSFRRARAHFFAMAAASKGTVKPQMTHDAKTYFSAKW
jgi:hypothetical protein